jgi:branched-chain amino acid transport system permease protein
VTQEGSSTRHRDFAGALKHAALAAVVAFGLFSLLVGIRTDTGPGGGLELSERFETLAVLVAVAFAGVFLREFFFPGVTLGAASFVPESVRRSTARIAQFLGPGLLIFAAVAPIIFYDNRYLLDLSIQILTYVMLGWGLNIVVGLAGLLDLGYVAFYAVGAYSYALLAQSFGLSFWICLPLAGILAAFWGVLLGFPVLRLRGDYLAIVTLAFGEIIRLVLINWQSLTGGPNGISSIPRPSFFGLPFNSEEGGFAHTFGLEFSPTHRVVFLYYVILALALLTNMVTIRLRRLPIGRAWEALREDEIACRSLGINTTNTKLTAFAMGATGIHQPGILRVPGIGDGAGDRRPGWHGLADRGRHCRYCDARRLRILSRVPTIPHGRIRSRYGCDHDLAAAWVDFDAHALGIPEKREAGRYCAST